MEELRNAYKILVGEPGKKRALEGLKNGCKDSIKLDVKEVPRVLRCGLD
jgi:hypothetical protein